MSSPDIKQNPHPKQRYAITMTIEDAPGPFDSVTASMGFNIVNAAECAPQDPISGAHPTPDYDSPITLSQVGKDVYKGSIYLDLARDGDYYGKGICHWKFVAASVVLKRHGVTFGSGIFLDAIISGATVREYAPKRLYFGSQIPDMQVITESMSEDKAKHRAEYFSIALVATEDGHE